MQPAVLKLIDKELQDGRGLHEIVERFRNCVMVRALNICSGNRSHAAELLKTHRNTVTQWTRKYPEANL